MKMVRIPVQLPLILPPSGGIVSDVPKELNALHGQLRAIYGQWHHLRFPVRKDFGHRFLAKLALGCGALFLKPDFLRSPDATLLRNFMWGKTSKTGVTFLFLANHFCLKS